MIRLKRVYDPPEKDDGKRFLVERLWPRGMKKEALQLDGWLKEVSPSPELRRWFGHQPEKWPEFQRRYRAELADHERDGEEGAIGTLLDAARSGNLTLLYSARNRDQNSALVLREFLQERLGESPGR